MQAVILAAGRGERMRPLTDKTPKPMLRLADKPILDYAFQNLPAEINEVILVVGYKQEQIRDYFGQRFLGRRIKYIDCPEILGTGGALHRAKDILQERFLVLMGDDLYFRPDLEKCLQHPWSFLAKEFLGDQHRRVGKIEITPGGFFKNITGPKTVKKKEKRLVGCGAYVLNFSFFGYPLVKLTKSSEFGLPQTLARAAADLPIKIVLAKKWFPTCQPADLPEAEKFILEYK
ncbi:MAG: hypothetical protein COU85_00930 [Candidatus Portnoybacteria bacterium CG10_big_fil_rev_8_21_14_0_10_44_7]|uniref:Nucleotidyl transferase domain-containing protein n=1 Tax=Candidatus Portnoybacteria bacterium CG10_big_fil_rev_8_21_14_0_10_44_7 TaxID=1974816 RepID=A0A2M8KJ70_9BACT|nr:MAG: hypothetical protein COU85_00930 [Candidatus Portnoybacteria bacterium CG10_big_fil_rev_8_21_14_0_10_44_7]